MKRIAIVLLSFVLSGCLKLGSETAQSETGRWVMFVGVDISGSFLRTQKFRDSIKFLSHYLYAHVNGLGKLESPHSLFVGPIGGRFQAEQKTFFPIETFKYKSIAEIENTLSHMFSAKKANPYTDYNAFFETVAAFIQNRKLVLRPISIVMISDGLPEEPKKNGKFDYRSIHLGPLENLSRNITLRLLYTDAETGMNWQTQIKRQRVKIWTQDAEVMRGWNSNNVMLPGKPLQEQQRFFSWVSKNVDFDVRLRRVD